jgi:hypothetical protein
MIAKIVSGLLKAFPLLALVSCANTHGGNDTVKATPKYLQYANDPVQNLYVIGFVGFTINEKGFVVQIMLGDESRPLAC